MARYRSDCSAEQSDHLDRCLDCGSPHARVVDRSSRLPAMLTLTYPGDWLTVAPDGETAKRHLRALCKRYARTWGEELIGPWKLEFQRRGAPHFPLSTTPPMDFTTITDADTGELRRVDFRGWLSITWADIVDHPDPEQRRHHRIAGTGVDYAEGIKLTDPRQMAVYFTKYGTAGGKNYQHRVPAEWCSAALVCDGCAAEYDTDLDACRAAEAWTPSLSTSAPVPAGSGATAVYAPSSPPARSPPPSASRPGASCVAGTAPRASPSRLRSSRSSGPPVASTPAAPASGNGCSYTTAASPASTTAPPSRRSSPATSSPSTTPELTCGLPRGADTVQPGAHRVRREGDRPASRSGRRVRAASGPGSEHRALSIRYASQGV